MKKIFFAYSDDQEDLDLYKELKLHFTPYAKKGVLKIIDKEELFRMSSDKDKAIEQLRESDLTVPLLSIDYLNSEECLHLLETAVIANKTVIPVLLRACDWAEIDKNSLWAKNLLPEDKQSVVQHIKAGGDDDKIFNGIALLVKAFVLNDVLGAIKIPEEKKTTGLFYYLLAGVVFISGILASVISYSQWGDWKISALAVLMGGSISLLALKNVFFPTKFKK